MPSHFTGCRVQCHIKSEYHHHHHHHHHHYLSTGSSGEENFVVSIASNGGDSLHVEDTLL